MATTHKQPEAPSAPAAPALPPSRLARAQAVLEAADVAQRQARDEIATLQERQRKTERELAALDGNTMSADLAPDGGARLDRRLALQQELTAIREMLPALNKRQQEVSAKQSRARDEVKAVGLRVAYVRERIVDQQGRIRMQHRRIEEAESQVMGQRNVLTNMERQLATWNAEIEETVGAEVTAQN